MNACESHSWKEAAMNSNNRLPVLMPILALQLVCGCGGGSQSSGSMFPPDISGSYTITLVGSSGGSAILRSEEHTSELQSLTNLVCRLLLEKKKKNKKKFSIIHDMKSFMRNEL